MSIQENDCNTKLVIVDNERDTATFSLQSEGAVLISSLSPHVAVSVEDLPGLVSWLSGVCSPCVKPVESARPEGETQYVDYHRAKDLLKYEKRLTADLDKKLEECHVRIRKMETTNEKLRKEIVKISELPYAPHRQRAEHSEAVAAQALDEVAELKAEKRRLEDEVNAARETAKFADDASNEAEAKARTAKQDYDLIASEMGGMRSEVRKANADIERIGNILSEGRHPASEEKIEFLEQEVLWGLRQLKKIKSTVTEGRPLSGIYSFYRAQLEAMVA